MRDSKRDQRRNKHFDVRLPPHLHDNLVDDLGRALESSIGILRNGVSNSITFKAEWQQAMMMSKFSDITTKPANERRESAIKKWLLAESRNRATNTRLLIDECNFPIHSEKAVVTSKRLKRVARKVVSSIIGETPPDDIMSLGGFTGGASTRVKRGPGAIAQKFVGQAHVTQEGLEVFRTKVLPLYPAWTHLYVTGEFSPVVVDGSMMFTVPKNSEIDRVACKEPELNMYMQRSCGLYIRQQLRRNRIDLRDQSINRGLAKKASIDRHLATIDLSSASDLISTQLVYDLLPLDWFLLLDSVRVKTVDIDGDKHDLSMFSSMGNGFTFELESLLFYALGRAINHQRGIRGRLSVYGDDIVTPTSIAPFYARVFSWFGFVINSAKSFWTGSFRESCGGHYYDGFDVTPFYIRARIATVPDLILVLNQLRKWGAGLFNIDSSVGNVFATIWTRYSKYVPPMLHGGKDLDSTTSLATEYGSPRKALAPVKRDVSVPQLGAYIQWLHVTKDRREAPPCYRGLDIQANTVKRVLLANWLKKDFHTSMETSDAHFELSFYKLVRNRLWKQELHPTSECWYLDVPTT